MQNPFKLSAIVIACALALSACSSSSSGDGSNVTPTPPETSTPDNSTPDNSTPDNSNPDNSNPDNSNPDNGTPDNGTPDNGTPDNSTPDNGTPDNGTPDDSTPDNGTPDNSTPDTTSYVVPEGIAQNSFDANTSVSYDAANFDKITVDGVEIQLSEATKKIAAGNPNFVHSVYYTDKGENNGTNSSLNFTGANVITSQRESDISDATYEFANVVAGAVVAGDNQYLFVQGTPTELTAVPTGGTATYNGGFLRFAGSIADNLFQESGAITGNFTAEVDFDAKTISGQIRNGNGAPTTVAETFEGTVSSEGFTADWTDGDTGDGLKGNFYGSTAEEVGGTFERSDSFGVFVGKQ